MDAKAGTLTRAEISEQSQWDLSGLYSSNDDWIKDFETLEGDLTKYASFQGALGQSFLQLKKSLF